MLSEKSWRHALWTTLITRCLLRKAAVVPLFPDTPRAAEGRLLPYWESCPLQVRRCFSHIFVSLLLVETLFVLVGFSRDIVNRYFLLGDP